MKTMSPSRCTKIFVVLAICLGLGTALWRLFSREAPTNNSLRISLAGKASEPDPGGKTPLHPKDVVPDDIRLKYDPLTRAAFHLTSTESCAILVCATGVEIRTPSGWKTVLEDYRGEIWRLKPGIPREVCVEPPSSETWRAYLRYGKEIKGAPLLKIQLQGAWKARSFSNWTGKAWGGGRFRGNYQMISEEIKP